METEIILHRGYKGIFLENSTSSFENALKEGMSFETDLRMSRDLEGFMIHDENLDRLLNAKGRVGDYTSQELGHVRYKEDGSHLVSYKELLNLVRKNKSSGKIFVHIKRLEDFELTDIPNPIVIDRFRFFACDELTLGLVKVIKEDYPEYEVGLHVTEDSPYKSKKYFEIADFIWADEITKKNITPELVSLSHGLGKPIYAISPELITESVFNQNIERRWRELIETGVDGICTDKPIELSNLLKRINSSS